MEDSQPLLLEMVCKGPLQIPVFPPFLQYLNSIRPGVIQFTYEMERNCALPFLVVLVSRSVDGNLFTSVLASQTTLASSMINIDMCAEFKAVKATLI